MEETLDEAMIWEELRRVYDPEIPTNIVDLGLVYSVDLEQEPDGHYTVDITMTLTSPGCSMGSYLVEQARQNILTIPQVKDVNVRIVWDPPWNREMISEAGKMELGLI